MNITQIIHGYCDANVYGVVLTFNVQPVGKEYSAYVDFDRRTGKINLPTTIKDSSGQKVLARAVWVRMLEARARDFVGTVLPNVN
jgi:hypothetical protein